LRENAPEPYKGQNYHQWLTRQYGLKKLVEHIWMVIGMARACSTMEELRRKKAEASGRQKIEITVYVPPKEKGLFDDLEDDPGKTDNGPQSTTT
jgi:hypothetical protein